ncbi:MAG: hypothetical protein OEY06_01725 [Gammaproteobacteria bacterium]|nr:hypothetical protein [Gammaproteobacteria bacterium]
MKQKCSILKYLWCNALRLLHQLRAGKSLGKYVDLGHTGTAEVT